MRSNQHERISKGYKKTSQYGMAMWPGARLNFDAEIENRIGNDELCCNVHGKDDAVIGSDI